MRLEVDKAQKEADIQIRNGEVAALQKEQDALNTTVSQLENQKAEAQKRLDELDDKVNLGTALTVGHATATSFNTTLL